MNKKERLSLAYEYLKNQGKVHTQKDVAEIMKTYSSNISAALNGKEAVLTDSFFV